MNQLPPNGLPDPKELARIAERAAATQKTLEALFFHFSKNKMSTMDAMVVLSLGFKQLVNQQDTDEKKKEMTALFHQMTKPETKPSFMRRMLGKGLSKN